MSTNTLPMPSRTAAPAIGSAFNELFTAASHLVAAVYASVFKTGAPRDLTVFEEAEQVRMLAESYADSDHGFAADLFAAADRHELQYGAK